MVWFVWLACSSQDEAAKPEVQKNVEAAAEAVLENPKLATGAVSSVEKARPTNPPPLEPVVTKSGIGFLAHDTSRRKIERKLGGDKVVEHRFDQGEGIFLPGLKLLPGTPWELNLQTDGETIERIEVIGSGYELASGVRLGASLSDLREALGPFELYGYGWDHGGTLLTPDFEPPGFQIAVQTEPAKHDEAGLGPKGREVLRGGESTFPSTHPGLDELEPHVASITLVWRGASGR